VSEPMITSPSTSASRTRPSRGLSGWHVLAAMVGFFAVIVAADATMIYKALSTFGGVDNDNAYRDGLAYNTRILSAERQAGLGWQDKVDVLADPAKLRVSFRDRGSNPVTGLKVETRLARPATNRLDATLAMSEVAPGVFEAVLANGEGGGTWIADVRAYQGSETSPVYLVRRRIWVAP